MNESIEPLLKNYNAMLSKLKKVANWLDKCADSAEKNAAACTEYRSLQDGYLAEAKNLRATSADIRKTIADAEKEATG